MLFYIRLFYYSIKDLEPQQLEEENCIRSHKCGINEPILLANLQ